MRRPAPSASGGGKIMGFSWFWKGRRTQPRRRVLHVVMFTRQGCHLCDTAWQLLLTRHRIYGFRLEMVDVDNDAELAARYGLEVPVVTVDGHVRFRGGVDEVLLDRLLRVQSKLPHGTS